MTSARHLFINLDQAPYRRTHVENTFAALNIAPTRVAAVDGRTLTETQFRELNPPSPTYQALTPGEIGCFLSHRKVWEIIAKGTEDMVAVFEDDVHLSLDAARWLTCFDWVPQGVDFIKLDTDNQPVLLSKQSPLPQSGRSLSTIHSKVHNTAGYIISRRCAEQLLETLKVMERPVDVQMFQPSYRSFQSLRVVQIWPAICAQNDILSQTGTPGQSIEPSTIRNTDHLRVAPPRPRLPFGFSKIKRELHRPFRDLTDWSKRTLKTLLVRGHWKPIPFHPD